MLDRYLLEAQNALLRPVALKLNSRGVAADALTLTGFLFGVGSAVFVATGFAGTALIPIALNRLFDGLDGAVARLAGPTDRGAFLDIALDFAFYAMVPLAFAAANPTQNAMAACLLLASFMGTASSFLAFAVIAAKRGATSVSFPQKGIYYLGGADGGHGNDRRIHGDVSLAESIPDRRNSILGASAFDDHDALVVGVARVFGVEAVNLKLLSAIFAMGLLLAAMCVTT